MIIVKKWIGALAMVALCATTSLLFTACGGGDGDDGGYNGGGGNTSYTDYNSLLVGYWTGKGTNLDGESLSITVRFDSDRKGRIIMSTPSGISGADIDGWYAIEKEIRVPSEKFDYPLVWTVISGSIASGKMTIETQGSSGRYWGTVTLERDSESSSGGGSSSTNERLGSTKALIIRMVETSSGSSYSSSTATCYKMSNSRGGIDLYSNSSYTSKIGTASSNSLSTWGGYRVSSYDYMIRYNVTTHSSTYYFFN